MKKTIKNSVLVLVLTGLLVLPLLSFGFIQKTPEETQVLGAATYIRKQADKELNPVDQINLVVNLNTDESQTLYNVIPENYLDEKYQYVLVVPGSYNDLAKAELVENNGSYNLNVDSISEKPLKTIEVSILIFE